RGRRGRPVASSILVDAQTVPRPHNVPRPRSGLLGPPAAMLRPPHGLLEVIRMSLSLVNDAAAPGVLTGAASPAAAVIPVRIEVPVRRTGRQRRAEPV